MSANTMVNAQNGNDKVPARLPEEERPVHDFLTGAHTVGLNVDQCRDSGRIWCCGARDGNNSSSCNSEGIASAMRVAITSRGIPVVLCPRHAVALHKAAGVDTNTTLDAYLRRVVPDLGAEERRREYAWRSRQEVQGLLDLF